MFCGNGTLKDRDCIGKYDKSHNFCVNICGLRERCKWKKKVNEEVK